MAIKSFSQIADALERSQPANARSAVPTAKATPSGKPAAARKPYLFNLGLDFGTAFTKCMLRDGRQGRVEPIRFEVNGKPTFLLPSEVYLEGDALSTPLETKTDDHLSLGCLKMALYATVGVRRGDPWLLALARHWPGDTEEDLCKKVEALTVYFLAAVIRCCRERLLGRVPDFSQHPDDTFSVNMAVPIAQVAEDGVEEAFLHCLNRAWRLAHQSKNKHTLPEVLAAVGKMRRDKDEHLCSIYPEVSANVQAYARARQAVDGLYMFVDVGAGTIDASTFLYRRSAPDNKKLSYVSAAVMPLGSSQIEMRASAQLAADSLGQFRLCKEKGRHQKEIHVKTADEIDRVCKNLGQEILSELESCAGQAQQKFTGHAPRQQWSTLKILTGGGGCALPMYERAAANAFTVWKMRPPSASLPLPADVDWPDDVSDHASAFRRMTVAYGLSFDIVELDSHWLPEEIKPLPEEEKPKKRSHAPTKDEV